MRTVLLLILTVLCMTPFFSILAQETRNAEDERESNQYVQVTVAQSIVYKELDPKSDILLRVKKGEFLELDSEGKHWIRVRVKDEIGWLAKDDVRFFCLCSAEN